MQKARRAVRADPGKHYPDRLRPVRSGDRAEKNIAGRPLYLLQIPVAEHDDAGIIAVASVRIAQDDTAAGVDVHVVVVGREEGLTRLRNFAVLGQSYSPGTNPRVMCCTIRMGAGKLLGKRRRIKWSAAGPPVEATIPTARTWVGVSWAAIG